MLRGWIYSIKWFIQRGRRGWADSDAWNLTNYLERILAGALPILADAHGYPCVYEGPEDVMQFNCRGGEVRCVCAHEWNVELYRHAELFNRLARDEFWDFEEEEYVRETATAWLAKRWGSLWD